MKSLKACAEIWKFRQPKENESEKSFRGALADHVFPMDLIESLEIRNGVGWDRFSQEQNAQMLKSAFDEVATEMDFFIIKDIDIRETGKITMYTGPIPPTNKNAPPKPKTEAPKRKQGRAIDLSDE